jgi:3',5'-cyclic AMP phosphodiesterase CpdA
LKKSFLISIVIGSAIHLTICPLFAQSGDSIIAFLSDIHLHDVYADLNSKDFRGVFNPKTGKYATIRTMRSQLNSTRLFNENYFAFIQALEELRSKGIRLVVLPGDFTDDGQPMNVLALKRILESYASKYEMRFFITTGNHDPVKPFGGTGGKRDFLGVDGSEQAVAGTADFFPLADVAVSNEVNFWGYEEITQALSRFGFFPSREDLFWAHPFQDLDVDNYSFDRARKDSGLERRVYQSRINGEMFPDASYLVEPIDGFWLLALDGNVYVGSGDDWRASSVGFNSGSVQKAHQLEWIKKVVAEAKKRGKTLISFSHYPLVDFHDEASEAMKLLFGADQFQLARVPSQETSQQYAQAGIRVHFAGHMHINDTGIFKDLETGDALFNIQVPSLAAFPPAYKTLKIHDQNSLEIETWELEKVERMDEFFDLYEMEHRWLVQNQGSKTWDRKILSSGSYMEYTQNHLIGLTTARFIPKDWPQELAFLLQSLSFIELEDWLEMDKEEAEVFLRSKLSNDLDAVPSERIPGSIIDDFYLLKNGDELGKKLIKASNQSFYEDFFSRIGRKDHNPGGVLSAQLIQFFQIFEKLYFSLPSDHFLIDLQRNEIKRID